MEDFVERYKKILPQEFFSYWENPTPPSLRVNTLKIKLQEIFDWIDAELEQLKFYKFGFVVKNKELELGKLPAFKLGFFHTQEISSMIPVLALDVKPKLKILDLCAAPGSKTTQIAQHMKNKGVIVANDVKPKRIKALVGNCQRLGVVNVIVTMQDGRRFRKKGFDRVLVDAPCTSMGLRKKHSIWSLSRTLRVSNLQKKLILAGFDCLKRKGILVYSTCTVEPEENEEVVQHLLEKRENARVEKVKLKNLEWEEGLLRWRKEFYAEIKNCMRIYPWHSGGDAFFVAKIKKV